MTNFILGLTEVLPGLPGYEVIEGSLEVPPTPDVTSPFVPEIVATPYPTKVIINFIWWSAGVDTGKITNHGVMRDGPYRIGPVFTNSDSSTVTISYAITVVDKPTN